MAILAELLQQLLADSKEWARGKMWQPRQVLLFYLGYILFYHLKDPMYTSWFKPLNLGIHELGHMVFMPFGQFIGIAGGTILQCLVPIIGLVMFYRQRDYFAVAVAVVWLGTNFYDVAFYVADAVAMALPLVSPFAGSEIIHDWHYLLSHLGLLSWHSGLAVLLRFAGTAACLAGIGYATWLIWMMMAATPQQKAGKLGSRKS